ncbi:unnamed protein product (mitochondrion) [Plasmodiophora brassicae]|uniref:Uncharacterized protein n=1 Tax=Plasmodiophora brassicae TaxID=37360 RepID=A0A0G4J608_PLABS|nr:hypothetical protein PBRA_009228 [Plasmodiophora brassicae]SPR00270.1 unnamed protein product [Plasmodiophora brassicae]
MGADPKHHTWMRKAGLRSPLQRLLGRVLANKSTALSWVLFLVAAITICTSTLLVVRSRPAYLHQQADTEEHQGTSESYPGSPILESFLRRRSDTSCSLLQQQPLGDFPKVKPLSEPGFSFTSAWLKPEYPSGMTPPKSIPELYKEQFTLGGKIKISSWYFDQAYLGGTKDLPETRWTVETVNQYKKSTLRDTKYGSDGLNINTALRKYNEFVKDKRGVVIGSESPWVEAMALRAGSGPLLTVEFGKIISDHPMLSTMVPGEFTESFLNGEIEPFDFAISFSSLEHDGLGRYGDVVNPIGDLQSMTKALSYVKPGGLFFLGLMYNGDFKDEVVWNAHRMYGPVRLPHVMAGWHLADVIKGDTQHLLVLQNKNGCA